MPRQTGDARPPLVQTPGPFSLLVDLPVSSSRSTDSFGRAAPPRFLLCSFRPLWRRLKEARWPITAVVSGDSFTDECVEDDEDRFSPLVQIGHSQNEFVNWSRITQSESGCAPTLLPQRNYRWGTRMLLLWILLALWLCCAMVFPLYLLVKALYRPRLRTSATRIMRS